MQKRGKKVNEVYRENVMNKADKIKALLADPSANAVAMLSTVFDFPLSRTYFKVSDSSGRMVFDLRSWGYLTGKGHAALGLDEETASKAQDAYGDEIVTLLNKMNELALLERGGDSE